MENFFNLPGAESFTQQSWWRIDELFSLSVISDIAFAQAIGKKLVSNLNKDELRSIPGELFTWIINSKKSSEDPAEIIKILEENHKIKREVAKNTVKMAIENRHEISASAKISTANPGLRSHLVEMRVFGLHCLVHREGITPAQATGLNIVLQLFAEKMNKMTFKRYDKPTEFEPASSEVMKMIADDLEFLSGIVRTNLEVSASNPELLTSTPYDVYLPGGNLELKQHQIDMIEELKKYSIMLRDVDSNINDDVRRSQYAAARGHSELISIMARLGRTNALVDLKYEGVFAAMGKNKSLDEATLDLEIKEAKHYASSAYIQASSLAIVNGAPTGSGKSAAIPAAIAALLTNNPDLFVLFVVGNGQQGLEAACSSLKVCRDNYGFAVVTVTGKAKKDHETGLATRSIHISPAYGCQKNCHILLCTPDGAMAIINRYKNTSPNAKDIRGKELDKRFKFVTFFDEILVGADQPPPNKNGYLNNGTMNAIDVIQASTALVAISATLPNDAISSFRVFDKFARAVRIDDKSLTSLSIECYTLSGRRLLPYDNIRTYEELEDFCRRFESQPLIRRMITLRDFAEISRRLNFDVAEWLENVSNIRSGKMQTKLLQLMQTITGPLTFVNPRERVANVSDDEQKIADSVSLAEAKNNLSRAMRLKEVISHLSKINFKPVNFPDAINNEIAEEYRIDIDNTVDTNEALSMTKEMLKFSLKKKNFISTAEVAKKTYDLCKKEVMSVEAKVQNNKNKISFEVPPPEPTPPPNNTGSLPPAIAAAFIPSTVHHPETPYLAPGKLGQSFSFGGQALLTVIDPVAYVLENTDEYIRMVLKELRVQRGENPEAEFETVSEIVRHFNFADEIEEANKRANASLSKASSKRDKQSRRDERDEGAGASAKDELLPTVVDIRIGDFASVGTPSHAKFVGSGLGLRQNLLSFSRTPFNKIRDPRLKFLYLCGIAVFSNKIKDEAYVDVVYRSMTNGELAWIITDYSGCFGFNLKICAVVVSQEFADVVSISTIEQLVGRLCRMGKTYFGRCYIPENLNIMNNDHANEIQNMRFVDEKTRARYVKNATTQVHESPSLAAEEGMPTIDLSRLNALVLDPSMANNKKTNQDKLSWF